MDLENVLNAMEQKEEQEKVASAGSASPPEEAKLAAALDAAVGSSAPAASAPAAGGDTISDLMKMASELAGTEKEAELAHAALLGQAFADSAINKFAAYETAAGTVAPATKEAAAPTAQGDLKKAAQYGYDLAVKEIQQAEEAQEKLAAAAETMSPDDLKKFAADKGWSQVLEKMAADYKQGFDQAIEEAKVAAAQEFIKGAAEVDVLIQRRQAAQ